jgi:hypothetical protein
MQKRYALGIVTKDRWQMTFSTLMSLYYCDQNKSSFDLYLIDNGSSPENVSALKEWLKSNLVEFKNLYCLPEVSIAEAWNLFLSLTRNYKYRIKMDNDIVLGNTPFIQFDMPVREFAAPARPEMPVSSVNPGAIPSASIVKGAVAGVKKRYKKNLKNHSRFLDHMYDFHAMHNPDIVALLPVTPGETFSGMMIQVLKKMSLDAPYLFGACMMISKKCFDTIGYFDERVRRRIDVEYTGRAVRNGLNIGYHDSFWVAHIGAKQSTDTKEEREKNYRTAKQLHDTQPIDKLATSKWHASFDKLYKKAKNHKILILK